MSDQGVVVVDRGEFGRETVSAETGTTTPNVALKPMHPVAVVAVRAARTYLQALVVFIAAAGISMAVPDLSLPGAVVGTAPADLLQRLQNAAFLALLPALGSVIQNAIELLGRIDATYPRLRA